ncbi:MAG: metal ABC transporter permease [Phycisphaerales bacterium]
MIEALSYGYFQRALLAGLLASVACGVIGSFVIVRRMASVSGGLSHAAFGGVGLAYMLRFDPLIGAGVFALAGALGIGVLSRTNRQAIDTLVSSFWSVGMALGIVFIALTPGYAPELMSFLFGSIVYVAWEHVIAAAVLDVLVLAALALLYSRLQASSFDEEFSQVMGVPVGAILGVLMALIALTVVVLIQVVGVILVIALLTLPAASVKPWANTLRRMMIGACVVGAVCTVAGLFGSAWVSPLPTGPLIILTATAVFLVSTGAHLVVRRVRS